MTSINRRTVFRIGAAAGATSMLAACGGGESEDDLDLEPDDNMNPTGMPIVDEPITLTMLTRRSPNTLEDWSQVASNQKMEELSNVQVDWGLIPWEGGVERRNLALASGDYPGVLNRMGLGSIDLAQYGSAGTFLALNSLIDDYMPNLKSVLDERPDIRSGMTLPDGNIYGMPTIFDPDFNALLMARKLWVRQDWLDRFGMDIPTTLEEFDEYLRAAKTDNPTDGNGDVVPFIDGANGGRLVEIFGGTFEVHNRGRDPGHIDANESGDVRFYPEADGYREMMMYLHSLFAEGLVPADIFTIDGGAESDLGRQGLVAATVSMSPTEYYGDVGENYVPVPPLKRESGDSVPSWTSVVSPLSGNGAFVLTDKIEHPIETARWMDYYYSDEGSRLFFMGVEGESYEETGDGDFEFLPVITDNPEGLTSNEALRPYVNYFGGGYAGIVMEAYFKGTENSEQSRAGTEVVAEYAIDEVWPAFTFTVEESSEVTGMSVDIDQLVTESHVKFINGEMGESDWAGYVDDLESIGVPRYMEIQQAAYDRYSSA